MNRHPETQTPDPLETAAEWALRVEAGLSLKEDARLETWLEADPRHRSAYDAVLDADRALERHAITGEMMAMRDAALRARPEHCRPWRGLAAGLAALALGAGGWWSVEHGSSLFAGLGLERARTASYVTAANERATVILPDGSMLALNTDSAAEVVFDVRTRTVRLDKGQALFTIAHDPARPFEVLAAGRKVTALGTAFDVLLMPSTLRVAMVDGVARVSSDPSLPAQTLSKGEVMTTHPDGQVTIRKADAARLSEWRDGVVFFQETPLGEAVAEMNRYVSRPIVVADEQASALRVSGTFRVAEADDFAATMEDVFPLSIKTSADGRIILTSAPL